MRVSSDYTTEIPGTSWTPLTIRECETKQIKHLLPSGPEVLRKAAWLKRVQPQTFIIHNNFVFQTGLAAFIKKSWVDFFFPFVLDPDHMTETPIGPTYPFYHQKNLEERLAGNQSWFFWDSSGDYVSEDEAPWDLEYNSSSCYALNPSYVRKYYLALFRRNPQHQFVIPTYHLEQAEILMDSTYDWSNITFSTTFSSRESLLEGIKLWKNYTTPPRLKAKMMLSEQSGRNFFHNKKRNSLQWLWSILAKHTSVDLEIYFTKEIEGSFQGTKPPENVKLKLAEFYSYYVP